MNVNRKTDQTARQNAPDRICDGHKAGVGPDFLLVHQVRAQTLRGRHEDHLTDRHDNGC